MPSVHSQHKGGGLRPPPQRRAAFGRPPFVVSLVLAVNTRHILVLRRTTCALLRAKTSALLRRKTWAVLRARTRALLRANRKVGMFFEKRLWHVAVINEISPK